MNQPKLKMEIKVELYWNFGVGSGSCRIWKCKYEGAAMLVLEHLSVKWGIMLIFLVFFDVRVAFKIHRCRHRCRRPTTSSKTFPSATKETKEQCSILQLPSTIDSSPNQIRNDVKRTNERGGWPRIHRQKERTFPIVFNQLCRIQKRLQRQREESIQKEENKAAEKRLRLSLSLSLSLSSFYFFFFLFIIFFVCWLSCKRVLDPPTRTWSTTWRTKTSELQLLPNEPLALTRFCPLSIGRPPICYLLTIT